MRTLYIIVTAVVVVAPAEAQLSPSSSAKWILVTVNAEFQQHYPTSDGETGLVDDAKTGPRFVQTDEIFAIEAWGERSALKIVPPGETTDYHIVLFVQEGPKALCRVLNCLDATPPREPADATPRDQ